MFSKYRKEDLVCDAATLSSLDKEISDESALWKRQLTVIGRQTLSCDDGW